MINRVEMKTDAGPSIALREQGKWTISDPWGDELFEGTKPQVQKRMKERMELNWCPWCAGEPETMGELENGRCPSCGLL